MARRDAGASEDFLITGERSTRRPASSSRPSRGRSWSPSAARSRRAASCTGRPPASRRRARRSRSRPGRSSVGAARSAGRLPMIGRDADLLQLELVARRVFTERRPFLVSIVAPAGTGKTRLVEALLDRLPDIAPGGTVAIAQCLPYGQRLTYWPLRSVLATLVGIDDDTPPDEPAGRPRVAAGARRRGRAALPTPSWQRSARSSSRWSIGRPVQRLADGDRGGRGRRPLDVVLEDLHWSSDSLLDLLDSLVQPRPDLPILIVAVARPELLDRRAAGAAAGATRCRCRSSRCRTSTSPPSSSTSSRGSRRTSSRRWRGPTATRSTRARSSGLS